MKLFRLAPTWPALFLSLSVPVLTGGMVADAQGAGNVADPIVIGHRGASGFRPEHTLASYQLAIEQGADFIEPDLVPTGDGYLIARHENQLSGTTDVADRPEFANRKTTKLVDGVPTTGWFSEDFTLAEIKTLRARERIPNVRPDNTQFDGLFAIPTLGEVIDLVKRTEQTTGRKVGIYPETKHPTFFAKEGTFLNGDPIHMSLGGKLIKTLVEENFTDPDRIFIQSFEFENLIELQKKIMPKYNVDLPLVQLYGDIEDAFVQPGSNFSRPYDMVFNAATGADLLAIYGDLPDLVPGGITETTGYGDLVSREVLAFIAKEYAEGIGPWKNSFLLREPLAEPVDSNGDGVAEITTRLTGAVNPFLSYAFDAGLLVHPYTLRAEEGFLTLHPNGIPQSITGEILQLLGLGVNGFFIDQPIEGVKGRDLFLALNPVAAGGPANDLMLTKTANTTVVSVGQRITYTLQVQNNGSTTATGVKLTDTLPAGTQLVAASSGCKHVTGVVTCMLPDLTKDQSVTRIIQIRPQQKGELRNTASVSANEPDPNPGNNTATAVVTVR